VIWNITGDLLTLFEKMNDKLNEQVVSVMRNIKVETNKMVTNCPSTFDLIHSKISHFAIKKTMEQWALGHKPEADQSCSHTFQASWGNPCHHRLKELGEHGIKLTVDDYHQQWHLHYNPCISEDVSEISCVALSGLCSAQILTPMLLQQSQAAKKVVFEETWAHITEQVSRLPEVKRDIVLEQIQQVLKGYHTLVPMMDPDIKKNTRGRPSLKKKALDKTTKRNPSAWEMTEANYAPKPKRGRPRKLAPTPSAPRARFEEAEEEEEEEEEDHEDDDDDGRSASDDNSGEAGMEAHPSQEGDSEDNLAAQEEAQQEDSHLKAAYTSQLEDRKRSIERVGVQNPSQSPSIDIISSPKYKVPAKCRQCGNKAHEGGVWLCPKRPHVKVSTNGGCVASS
jgi:hypothetical protein